MKSNYKAYKAGKTLGQLTSTQQKIVTDYVVQEVNRIVKERLTEERTAAIDFAIDCTLMSVALEMIERFKWGAKQRAGQKGRLVNLITGVTERMCSEIHRYDEDFMFALQWKLREYGVEFEVSRLRERLKSDIEKNTGEGVGCDRGNEDRGTVGGTVDAGGDGNAEPHELMGEE
jgi:hypothetical protein